MMTLITRLSSLSPMSWVTFLWPWTKPPPISPRPISALPLTCSACGSILQPCMHPRGVDRHSKLSPGYGISPLRPFVHGNGPLVKLLHILVTNAPDSIPRPMLGGTDGMSKLVVDEALGLLASYSMTALTPETVTMHRLVQAVVLSSMPPPRGKGESFEDEDPLKTALEWLYNVIPTDPQNNTAAWPLFRAITPHAESLAAHFPLGSQPSSLARVQGELGLFQTSQGQYEQALRLNQSSLAIAEATFGMMPSTWL